MMQNVFDEFIRVVDEEYNGLSDIEKAHRGAMEAEVYDLCKRYGDMTLIPLVKWWVAKIHADEIMLNAIGEAN